MVEPLTSFSKIQVLLAEYAALRAEVLSRSAQKFQVQTLAGTALVAIVGLTGLLSAISLILLTILLTALGLRLLDQITRRLAARLREIETSVNGLAGETLLRWENESGVGPISYGERLKDILSFGATNRD
jgi:hypothetical protein